jgi:GT2 family glycosyltransferase
VTISFVIPVRNDARRLELALRSIAAAAAGAPDVELVVVDNGSTDESVMVARQHGALVLDRPGLPVSVLRNEGASAAAGDLLAFVDADNEIDSGWVAAARELFRDDAVAAIGAPYSAPAGANWVQQVYDGLRDHRAGTFDTEWLGSGNLAIRRDVFIALGGFDESLVTCEDVDLCIRLRAAGHRLIADSRLRSMHHGDPRSPAAVFKVELWRGRDNLRVTLRPPRSWRSLASLTASVLMLAGLAGTLASLVTGPWWLAAGSAAAVVAIVGMRTVRLARTLPSGVVPLLRAFVVAAAYEGGRALALVVRPDHHRRHPAKSAPAHV